MFRRVLIANRGEIALRIIRACRELGIETVAVYSEADADALYLRQADETICIGPAAEREVATSTSRDHRRGRDRRRRRDPPGLRLPRRRTRTSPRSAASCNIEFIGPDARGDRAAGRQGRARASWREAAGVPVVPGLATARSTTRRRRSRSRSEIGYPVMIKAAAGGGGRGMRVARNEPSLVARLPRRAQPRPRRPSATARVYLEKFVENPRHVEIQILADEHGNVVHLGERDCSIQRRHQKLVEESPSPALTPELRASDGRAAAVRVAQGGELHERGHGRVPGRPRRQLLLHRGQRAHPGRAPGHRDGHGHRPRPGADPHRRGRAARASTRTTCGSRGHAIECRINAEDPDARLPALARADRALRAARRPGRARRQPLLQRLPDPAELRLDDRQAARAPRRAASSRSARCCARSTSS